MQTRKASPLDSSKHQTIKNNVQSINKGLQPQQGKSRSPHVNDQSQDNSTQPRTRKSRSPHVN